MTTNRPSTFTLRRSVDVSGVSGAGDVAEGIEFTDGTVALRWTVGEHHSTVIWPNIEAVEAIHGHDGNTSIVWDQIDPDQDQNAWCNFDNGTGKCWHGPGHDGSHDVPIGAGVVYRIADDRQGYYSLDRQEWLS